MSITINLKNSADVALVDQSVYDWLAKDKYFQDLGFLQNIRKHSSGCAVFQKTWKQEDGKFKTKTLYLHKIIAEKYLSRTKTSKQNLVGAINGNKLDCRLENLIYRSRATASRRRKSSSKTGFAGVYQEKERFRAVISIDGKAVHLGMFETAEDASAAYQKVSRKLLEKELDMKNKKL